MSGQRRHFSVFSSSFGHGCIPLSFLVLAFLLLVHPTNAAVNLIYPQNGNWINYPVFKFNHTLAGAATCTLRIYGFGEAPGTFPLITSEVYSDIPPNVVQSKTPKTSLPENDLLLWNVSCTYGTLAHASPSWIFVIDREPPNVTATATDSENETVEFFVSVADDTSLYEFGSIESGNTANCSLYLNGIWNASYTMALSDGETAASFIISPLSGAVAWQFVCKDRAGNIGSSLPAVVSANDTTAPAIYLDIPEDGSIVNRINVNMIFVAFDNSSLSYCNLYLDGMWTGQSTNVLTSPAGGYGQFRVEGLAVGAHNWSVSCADRLGHEGSSAISFFTVGPESPVTVTDRPSVYINSPDPAYAFVEKITLSYTPYDSRHNAMNCSIYVDGALADQRTAYNGVMTSVTFENVKFTREGRHVWSVRCSDDAGNIGKSKQAVYVISLTGIALPPEKPLIFALTETHLLWSGIIIGIAALLLGMAFMASKVFLVPAWEAWVREEFGNLLFTAFILVAFTMFSGVIEFASDQLAKDVLFSAGTDSWWYYGSSSGRWTKVGIQPTSCPYPCHFYIARGFLGAVYEDYAKTVESTAKILAVSRLFESFGLGTNLDLMPWVTDIDIGFGIPLYPGRAVFNNSLAKALDELLRLCGMLKAQEVMLGYLPGLSGVFFITGILFRIPWFTRKLGGLLVALAIGIYAILPLVYVLAWYSVDRSSVVFDETMLSEDVREISFGELGNVLGGKTSVASLFTVYDGAGKEVRIGLLDMVGRAYLLNTLIPVLAIFATIGFVRHFSPMIGGDVEIAGLTRII